MNKRKLSSAEAKMWQVELMRRRIAHAPPELRDVMMEQLGQLHADGRRMVREAAEAEEEDDSVN